MAINELRKGHLCIKRVKIWHGFPIGIGRAKSYIKCNTFAGKLMCEMGVDFSKTIYPLKWWFIKIKTFQINKKRENKNEVVYQDKDRDIKIFIFFK